jgi:hypothetical protein
MAIIMSRDSKFYTLANAIAPRAISSSTNATPIVVTTAAAHGFTTGDNVTINGHATNTAANGTWVVTVTGASTFSLDGCVGNGVGGATGVYAIRAGRIDVRDFRTAVLAFDTDGGGDAAFTVKMVGSIAKDIPDFADSQSPSNQYDFLDAIDLEDGAATPGDTGFVVATADDNRQYEVNINGIKWLSVLPTAGTAGELTVTARLFTNT